MILEWSARRICMLGIYSVLVAFSAIPTANGPHGMYRMYGCTKYLKCEYDTKSYGIEMTFRSTLAGVIWYARQKVYSQSTRKTKTLVTLPSTVAICSFTFSRSTMN